MILNVFLFLVEFLSEYFFVGSFAFSFWDQVKQASLALALIAVVLAVQTLLVRWVTLERKFAKILRSLLWAHLPWVLGIFWPIVQKLNLPDPHNTLVRKVEILFGIIIISHLFLFARLLLKGSAHNGWKDSKIFGVVGLIFFVSTTLWTASVCDLSGDEPHYLLMAYSLLHDGDLDLSNNYANRDYEKFYQRGTLEPQGLEHVVGARRYSHHPLGPVLLVLPGFTLAGRLGAALTIALLAALALYLTLRVLELNGARGWPLHATGIVGLFSSPFLLFSGLIFPEIPTACLVALGLLIFIKKRWGWMGITLGVMLWMHNRNVLLVLPLLFFSALEIWKEKKSRGEGMSSLLSGFVLPVALLAFYFHYIYGVWTPLGAHNEAFTSLFRLSHFWEGFFGLVMDQECGLWFHFPIFTLVVTGGILLWRSKNPLKWVTLGTMLFYYFFMCFYENLGLTPATRYMVGVTPLLLMLVYPGVQVLKPPPQGPKSLIGETPYVPSKPRSSVTGRRGHFTDWNFWTFLAGFSLTMGALMNWVLAAIPWLRYNKLDGENWVLKFAGHFLYMPLTSLEPAFNPPVVEMKSYILASCWVIATVVLSVWFLKEKQINRR